MEWNNAYSNEFSFFISRQWQVTQQNMFIWIDIKPPSHASEIWQDQVRRKEIWPDHGDLADDQIYHPVFFPLTFLRRDIKIFQDTIVTVHKQRVYRIRENKATNKKWSPPHTHKIHFNIAAHMRVIKLYIEPHRQNFYVDPFNYYVIMGERVWAYVCIYTSKV